MNPEELVAALKARAVSEAAVTALGVASRGLHLTAREAISLADAIQVADAERLAEALDAALEAYSEADYGTSNLIKRSELARAAFVVALSPSSDAPTGAPRD